MKYVYLTITNILTTYPTLKLATTIYTVISCNELCYVSESRRVQYKHA